MRKKDERWFGLTLVALALTVMATPTLASDSCPEDSPPALNEARLRWTDGGRTTLSFERGVNHILVQTTGEKRYTFLVDTGATLTVVTPAFAESYGTQEYSAGIQAEAQGASGEIAGAPTMVRIRDLPLGDMTVDDAVAVTLDLDTIAQEMKTEIHGIIGYNVLSQLTTVIDYSSSKITFTRSDAKNLNPTLGSPKAIVPFGLRMGALIEVVGAVNGGREETRFIVDTGSRLTALNGTASESSGVEFELHPNQPTALGLGNDSETSVRSGTAESLSIGDLEFGKTSIYSVPLPVFQTLGLADRSAGLLGNDLLGLFTVAIDYRAGVLVFWEGRGQQDRSR